MEQKPARKIEAWEIKDFFKSWGTIIGIVLIILFAGIYPPLAILIAFIGICALINSIVSGKN